MQPLSRASKRVPGSRGRHLTHAIMASLGWYTTAKYPREVEHAIDELGTAFLMRPRDKKSKLERNCAKQCGANKDAQIKRLCDTSRTFGEQVKRILLLQPKSMSDCGTRRSGYCRKTAL